MRLRLSPWLILWNYAKRWLVTILATVGIVICFMIGFLDCTMDIRQSWVGLVCATALLPYFWCIAQFQGGDAFAGSWQTWPEALVFTVSLAINAYVVIRPAIACDRWRRRHRELSV